MTHNRGILPYLVLLLIVVVGGVYGFLYEYFKPTPLGFWFYPPILMILIGLVVGVGQFLLRRI